MRMLHLRFWIKHVSLDEPSSSSMRYLPSQQLLQRTEQTADIMVACFLSFLATLIWKYYHAEIKHVLEIVFEFANGVLTK